MNNVEDILKQIGSENKNTAMNIFISSYWYLNIDNVHYMFKKSTLNNWEIEVITENVNSKMSFETYKNFISLQYEKSTSQRRTKVYSCW